MALAPAGYLLWTRHLRHDPPYPAWPDRDRFVLSCGHASMLLYSPAASHRLRPPARGHQALPPVGLATPGHPEHGHTPASRRRPARSVRASATRSAWRSPSASGRAVQPARTRDRRPLDLRHLQRRRPDGGRCDEAASLAGHLKLGKLIVFLRRQPHHHRRQHRPHLYRGLGQRFEAYGWHVLHIADGNDLEPDRRRR